MTENDDDHYKRVLDRNFTGARADKPCTQCTRYRLTTREGGLWETCGDNGRSISFMRDPIGVYGEPHCGPQGKYYQPRE